MATNKQLPLPQPVKVIDIRDTDEKRRIVKFDSSLRLADKLRVQGIGSVLQNPRTGLFTLRVSGRFDFAEIVDWLSRLDPEGDEDESGLPEEESKFDA